MSVCGGIIIIFFPFSSGASLTLQWRMCHHKTEDPVVAAASSIFMVAHNIKTELSKYKVTKLHLAYL